MAFIAPLANATLFVTRDGRLVYSFGGWALVETPRRAHALPRGACAGATRASRFLGDDPARWQPDVATYDRVTLGEAWPGITVDLAARGRTVEKIFTVAPGADARRIGLRVDGADRLARGAGGELVARTRGGAVRFSAPVAWQEIAGERRAVDVRYTIAGSSYGFALGPHDRAHPVVIDPLLQATYAGGSGSDVAYAVAVNAGGDVFVAGSTGSFNFPGTNGGAQPGAGGGGDAFVAKFTRDLTAIVQVTYVGGSGSDFAQALAFDDAGAVVVAGSTNSLNFPGTAGGAQETAGGGGDAFVARFTTDLRTLLQATYVGGSGFDQGFAVASGADGSVYVAGGTASSNFPATTGGAQAVRGGSGDAFCARLSRDLKVLMQATYLGGSSSETAFAVAQHADGAVYVAGNTVSANFPGTADGAQPAPGGGGDAFVAKLDRNLVTLTRATYVGGASADLAYALALAPDGTVLIAGDTASANFPATAGGAQPARGGANDAFVAKLDHDLKRLLQATYVGGSADDLANALAIDAAGAVYVAGNTRSTAFPGTAGGAQADPGGNGDAFVARLDATLTMLAQASYLGGSNLDQALALALDARGKVYVAGGTASLDFPATAGGPQPQAGGNGDAFVAVLTASLRAVDSPAIEFRYAAWDHYFVTASTDEIAKLDAGVFAGWTRTGQSFKVLSLDTAGTASVCRFFSVSFAPKSSHFYTPSASECELIKQSPDWQFEAEVFAVRLPDPAGSCASGTLALYRLYNDGQGGAPNHRYTTSAATRADMVGQGWIPEGTGDLGVIACVPE
ncbi:MAG: hypothetical protein U1F15_02265 [Burkholderiales bacterium]